MPSTPHQQQQIVPRIASTFILCFFCQIFTVSTQQQIAYAFPLAVVPLPLYVPTFVGFDSSHGCQNGRPDCHIFQHLCDHPDYKQYMYRCCRGTCDPKCGQRVESSSVLTPGDEKRAMDEVREQRNEGAIRRKYLGDNDYFRPQRDERQHERTTQGGPFGADYHRQIPEGAKWRDDDRWDRNDPWTLRRVTEDEWRRRGERKNS